MGVGGMNGSLVLQQEKKDYRAGNNNVDARRRRLVRRMKTR